MSGLTFLYKLLLKETAKGSGKASGILSIGRDVRKLADKKFQSYVMTAQKQGVDIDKLSEQEIKYMLQLNQPKPIKAISADSPEGQGITRDLFNMLDRQSGKNVIKTDFGGGITDDVSEIIIKIKTMEPVAAMKEANLVIGRKGIYKNLTKEQSQKILKDTDDWIFQRDPDDLYDYNKKRPFRDDPDPEDFAHGGRTGTGLNYLLGEDDQNVRVPFGLGGFNAARRAFLKAVGAGAAGVGAAKSGLLSIFKGGGKKEVIKELTQVPIKNIEGMPAWFKPLVNKVIKEGKAEKITEYDRLVTHTAKLPESKTPISVSQDLNTGDVWVDIGAGKHGFPDGHFGQPVRLEYKAAEDIMSGPSDEPFKVGVRDPLLRVKSSVHEDLVGSGLKGDPKSLHLKPGKTKEEFWVEEAEFTGGHPENIKFEESTLEKFGQHGSNFDEVEMFATGKIKKVKPTKKKLQTEFEQGRAEVEADDLAKEAAELDPDFASGGRVPLGHGGKGTPRNRATSFRDYLQLLSEQWDDMDPDEWVGILRSLGVKGHASGGRVPLGVGGIAGMLGE